MLSISSKVLEPDKWVGIMVGNALGLLVVPHSTSRVRTYPLFPVLLSFRWRDRISIFINTNRMEATSMSVCAIRAET